MKLWYAVMLGNDDSDWGTGSYDKGEAIQMAMEYRADGFKNAYVAIIDEGDDPVCIEEIREF